MKKQEYVKKGYYPKSVETKGDIVVIEWDSIEPIITFGDRIVFGDCTTEYIICKPAPSTVVVINTETGQRLGSAVVFGIDKFTLSVLKESGVFGFSLSTSEIVVK
ncbi:MAG: hypothetical protein JKX82_04960 [Oleispira sp.]|nr:hypothetical protein [Oleispira sp.]